MKDFNLIKNKRIYWVHGALDWMFPIHMAREGYRALKAAGAENTGKMWEDKTFLKFRQSRLWCPDSDFVPEIYDLSLACCKAVALAVFNIFTRVPWGGHMGVATEIPRWPFS